METEQYVYPSATSPSDTVIIGAVKVRLPLLVRGIYPNFWRIVRA